jgi:hypothetical protein
MNATYYSSLIPLRQLPPQGNWCLPNICVGLRSMLATCAGIRAFSNCDSFLPSAVPLPPKTVHKLETKPSMLERRPTLPPRVEEPAPPKSSGKKQVVESFMPPTTVSYRHPLAVPSLDLSKVSNLNREGAQKFALATHRVLPSSMFLAISSDKPGVSFCMPKGMDKQFSSRHLKLPMPPPLKNHPIFTNRRPSRLGQK